MLPSVANVAMCVLLALWRVVDFILVCTHIYIYVYIYIYMESYLCSCVYIQAYIVCHRATEIQDDKSHDVRT